MNRTKAIVLLSLIGMFLFANAQEKNKIELILLQEKNQEYSLKIKNNSNISINMPRAAYQDFWCIGIPCINFIGEVKKNGEWKDLMEFKSTIRDFSSSSPIYTEINPQETKVVGSFKFPKQGIDTWFGLFGNQKIRIAVEYIIGKNKKEIAKLKLDGISPVHLMSNKIELDYTDNNSQESKNYIGEWMLENFIIKNKIVKSHIRKGAIIIDKPKNGRDALIKGLSNEKFKIKKWKLISSFFGNTSDGLIFRGTLFEANSKKYFGISTQKYRFNKDDKSDKYFFNIIETSIP